MAFTEKTVLLHTYRRHDTQTTLSVFFGVICVIDVFGVFPIITLPRTIISCGAYGLLMVFATCSIQVYTAILLGKSWLLACEIEPNIVEKNRRSYSALVQLTYGKRCSRCISILLSLTIFSCGIPNFIVASQNLDLFTIRLFGSSISYCWWILIIGTILCPILWLGSPKDMKFVCSVSVLTVLFVFLFVVIGVTQTNSTVSVEQSFESDNLGDDLWRNMIIAYGVLSFQFDIHPTLLAIQNDMEKKYKIVSVIVYGFGVSLVMFLVIYILAYTTIGVNVKSSILESLPTSVILHLAALLAAFQLCLSSAISNSALYQNLEHHLGISKDFTYKRCLLRTFLTILAIILAECVPNFDLVMALIGGTLTGPLVFVVPPLIHMKLATMKRSNDSIKLNIVQHPAKVMDELCLHYNSVVSRTIPKCCIYSKVELIVCSLVLFIGTIGTIATTYVNLANSSQIQMSDNFALPCIYNISLIF